MEGEEELLWKSEPQRESIVSITLARAITSLLTSRAKKLHDSISHLSSHSSRSHTSLVSLEDSLWFFHSYVADAATNNSSLDQVLLPIIDSVCIFSSSICLFRILLSLRYDVFFVFPGVKVQAR